MPELPEVETMRRGLLPVVGGRIVAVRSTKCRRKPIAVVPRLGAFRRRVVGRKVVAVERVGKRVVLRLDSAEVIVFEPRMTGLVLLADPPTNEHLRLRILFQAGGWRSPGGRRRRRASELYYWDRRGLGSVRLVSDGEFTRLYGAGRLGPDALAISADELRQRLAGSRRAIKVALLDQRAVAGIGNLYASEILHEAGIWPLARCDRLRAVDWRRLHAAMAAVLNDAIRFEGSTLSDGTYRNALNQAGSYQNHHRVYDRQGQACRRCRSATIQRIVQAQRSTFFCPGCQRRHDGRPPAAHRAPGSRRATPPPGGGVQ